MLLNLFRVNITLFIIWYYIIWGRRRVTRPKWAVAAGGGEASPVHVLGSTEAEGTLTVWNLKTSVALVKEKLACTTFLPHFNCLKTKKGDLKVQVSTNLCLLIPESISQ